jgi:hypothetical protein
VLDVVVCARRHKVRFDAFHSPRQRWLTVEASRIYGDQRCDAHCRAAISLRAGCQLLPIGCLSAANMLPRRCHRRPVGCRSAAKMLPRCCQNVAKSCPAGLATTALNILIKNDNLSFCATALKKPASSASRLRQLNCCPLRYDSNRRTAGFQPASFSSFRASGAKKQPAGSRRSGGEVRVKPHKLAPMGLASAPMGVVMAAHD